MTSKNQITLPIEYVRDFRLQKKARFTVRRRGDELILKPAPSLDELMTDTWAEMKKHVKAPLTDRELHQAIRESVAYGAWRKES